MKKINRSRLKNPLNEESFSTRTAYLSDRSKDHQQQNLVQNSISFIFKNLAKTAISILNADQYHDEPEILSVLAMDMVQNTVAKNAFSGLIAETLNQPV